MVPTGDYELELHVADVVKEGTDITLIGWGAQMRVIADVIINSVTMAHMQG